MTSTSISSLNVHYSRWNIIRDVGGGPLVRRKYRILLNIPGLFFAPSSRWCDRYLSILQWVVYCWLNDCSACAACIQAELYPEDSRKSRTLNIASTYTLNALPVLSPRDIVVNLRCLRPLTAATSIWQEWAVAKRICRPLLKRQWSWISFPNPRPRMLLVISNTVCLFLFAQHLDSRGYWGRCTHVFLVQQIRRRFRSCV